MIVTKALHHNFRVRDFSNKIWSTVEGFKQSIKKVNFDGGFSQFILRLSPVIREMHSLFYPFFPLIKLSVEFLQLSDRLLSRTCLRCIASYMTSTVSMWNH